LNWSQSCQPDRADLSLTMRQELTDYFRTTVLEYDDDPLAWCKSHASDFPHVARAADTALSIPASSAPVERIFSSSTYAHRAQKRSAQLARYFAPKDQTHDAAVRPTGGCNKRIR